MEWAFVAALVLCFLLGMLSVQLAERNARLREQVRFIEKDRTIYQGLACERGSAVRLLRNARETILERWESAIQSMQDDLEELSAEPEWEIESSSTESSSSSSSSRSSSSSESFSY